jgi:hypothetical protein
LRGGDIVSNAEQQFVNFLVELQGKIENLEQEVKELKNQTSVVNVFNGINK